MLAVPRVGRSSVARIFNRVVLPAPLAPSSATPSPARISRLTPSRTGTRPKTLRTSTTRTMGSRFIRPTDQFSRGRRPRSRKRAGPEMSQFGSSGFTAASAHVARVPERIAPRLRPHREAVRLVAHGNRLHQLSVRGVDDVNDPVVAAGEPEIFAVEAEV